MAVKLDRLSHVIASEWYVIPVTTQSRPMTWELAALKIPNLQHHFQFVHIVIVNKHIASACNLLTC